MIELRTLSHEDVGRVCLYADEKVVLLDWNHEDGTVTVAYPDHAPAVQDEVDARDLEVGEGFAVRAYRYGMQFRPFAMGMCPRGFIPDPSLIPKYGKPDWQNPTSRFGFLDYPEPLPQGEVKCYELHEFGQVWRSPK